MKKNIAIIGAGGHGRICAEIAEIMGYQKVIVLDDNPNNVQSVSGTTDDVPSYINEYDFFVAIGDNGVRKKICEKVCQQGGTMATLIHPGCFVSKKATIGAGSVLMVGSVVNSGVRIGQNVIVNTCSSVDHDTVVSDYSHVAVGVHIAGGTNIGKNVLIGAGATVINNISIVDNTLVGAGAVVVKNIAVAGKYLGVPAKLVKK